MKRKLMKAGVAVIALVAATVASTAMAHDTPNMDHTHAFRQTGYGQYRQGHSVNGPYGSITIYSPRTYSEIQSAPAVEFARPEPITRSPGAPAAQTTAERNPAVDYGKQQKDGYGD